MSLQSLKKELKSFGNPQKAKLSARFFKTGPGQYGEGDVFLGITTPEQETVAKKYADLPLSDCESLLQSKEHEFRAVALRILVLRWKAASKIEQKAIHAIYLKNTRWINNWDLVDASASALVGEYLFEGDKKILLKLAKSKLLWERRIAMIATYAYIKKGDAKDALVIADVLLHDEEDLMHKAVGWMLREVGKRCSQEIEEKFLKTRYKKMPRTMLRYAIERFPEALRQSYLAGRV